MSKHLKLGLIIFNLVILTAFHRGDALECYVCHGEDDCLKDYPSEICIADVTTTESSEEETTKLTTENDSLTTTEDEASSPATTEAEASSPTTTEAEDSSTTTEAENSSTTIKAEDSSSTTTEAEDSSTTTEAEDSSSTTTEAEDSSTITAPGQGASDTNNYSVKQLYRNNVKSRRRRRFALSTREESWSCFKSVEGEKVIERGCINSDPPKDSTYELCQSDKCNPAPKIVSNGNLENN
ncbi:hypothetical protein HCN44_005125 [Aphidius gifuensis]|uniref:Venom protein n=1 Tax=Aphidius gifuensis TaxID=684658 RepID=A0A834XV98_APHGI|nr:hypothetical protein HCN44_005125 [Aphidius gifuensis]